MTSESTEDKHPTSSGEYILRPRTFPLNVPRSEPEIASRKDLPRPSWSQQWSLNTICWSIAWPANLRLSQRAEKCCKYQTNMELHPFTFPVIHREKPAFRSIISILSVMFKCVRPIPVKCGSDAGQMLVKYNHPQDGKHWFTHRRCSALPCFLQALHRPSHPSSHHK